jgi:hypothetical protein
LPKGFTVKTLEFKKTKAMTVKGSYAGLEDAYEELETAAKTEMPKIEVYIKGPKVRRRTIVLSPDART